MSHKADAAACDRGEAKLQLQVPSRVPRVISKRTPRRQQAPDQDCSSIKMQRRRQARRAAETDAQVAIGSVVWAKYASYPFWPAHVLSISNEGIRVCFYGDGATETIGKSSNVVNFCDRDRATSFFQDGLVAAGGVHGDADTFRLACHLARQAAGSP